MMSCHSLQLLLTVDAGYIGFADRRGISEQEAIHLLYSSKLYALLEQEDTKVWQYSTPMAT